MPKIDLLPCPFCGRTPKTSELHIHLQQISCLYSKCPAHPCVIKATMEEATQAWNTRASGWISCSERLPDEPGVHVIVTDGIHIMESWYEIIDGEMLWVDNYTMYVNINFGEVTHWMPLPNMPKRKDDTR